MVRTPVAGNRSILLACFDLSGFVVRPRYPQSAACRVLRD